MRILRCVKYEIKKIALNRWFYVGMLVMAILQAVAYWSVNYAISKSLIDSGSNTQGIIITGMSGIQEAFNMSGYAQVIAVVISAYISSDFSNGILKNELLSESSRSEAFVSKYLSAIFASDVIAMLTMGWGFVIASAIGGIGKAACDAVALNVVTQILAMNGYISIYFFVAVLVKKILPTVIINLFLPTVVAAVLTLLEKVFNVRVYRIWLDSLISDLIQATTKGVNYGLYISVALIYCTIFGTASIVLTRKVEV